MYLIDTNIFIRGFLGEEPDAAFLTRAIERKELYISVVSISEFLTQASKADEVSFRKLLVEFPILPVDQQVAELAALYRKTFLKEIRTKLLDYFLAAQAKVHHLTLVTHNKADFPMKDIRIMAPK